MSDARQRVAKKPFVASSRYSMSSPDGLDVVEVVAVVVVVGRADQRRAEPRQREDRAPAAGGDDRPVVQRQRLVGERDVRAAARAG